MEKACGSVSGRAGSLAGALQASRARTLRAAAAVRALDRARASARAARLRAAAHASLHAEVIHNDNTSARDTPCDLPQYIARTRRRIFSYHYYCVALYGNLHTTMLHNN